MLVRTTIDASGWSSNYLSVAVGSGLGATVGVLVGGGPGMAIGVGIGALLGVVADSVVNRIN